MTSVYGDMSTHGWVPDKSPSDGSSFDVVSFPVTGSPGAVHGLQGFCLLGARCEGKRSPVWHLPGSRVRCLLSVLSAHKFLHLISVQLNALMHEETQRLRMGFARELGEPSGHLGQM